jgi:DNA segregation ATPase FtsK/SpoIIIE, S-DNA-T family
MATKEKKEKKNEKKSVGFLHDERFKITVGLAVVLFAAFLLISFISYFFTWRADQSFEYADVISNAKVTVENWAGKSGARMSNLFINEWFGLASFSFPFLLILLGLKLFNVHLLPLGKTIRITLVLTILFSLTLGFIFGATGGYMGSGLGGGHGYFLSRWLNALMGKVGTFFFLMVIDLAFVFYTVKGSLEWTKKKMQAFIANKSATKTIDESAPVVEEVPDNLPQSPVSLNDEIEFTAEKSFVDENSENGLIVHDKKSAGQIKDPELLVEPIAEEDETEMPSELEDNEEFTPYDPTLDLSNYKFPTFDLLQDHKISNSEVSNEELLGNKNKIVETLANYKIQIDKIKATIGPTVTLYEIVPAPGVRISKIKNLEDDIALSLAALGIRIIAPIPGKGTIGIEVPNMQPEIVSMKSVITSRKFQESKYELPIALGKTISNESYVVDLTSMPHLLVAGATGQGKSVGLNAVITSLLYKKHPSQLKFVMVDPKKVELTLYSKLEKHFLAKLPDADEAIITDTQKVISTLNSLTVEMESRYDLLKLAHVRNIKEYNTKFIARKLNPNNGHHFMPYIVVVIDEFADLIMTAGKEVEMPLARLAQLARAIGIHLIIATQRPTTNIITGVIKANFPARIAFRVTSMVDSRTILDSPGANQLIGRGDMLVQNGDLIRVQCAFIDTSEIDSITDFISSQQGYPNAFELPEFVSADAQDQSLIDVNKRDEMFDEAARLVVAHQQGSTSLIQRKFSIGYNRAGRIMDQLEAAGVVGPNEGSKAREVRFSDLYALEQFLQQNN